MPGQCVIKVRTYKDFDAAQLVPGGHIIDPGGAIEEDLHSAACPGVGHCVSATATFQRIGTEAGNQYIIAFRSRQRLRVGAANQRVGKTRPQQPFDICQHVPCGKPGSTSVAQQADRDPCRRAGVGCGIKTRPADDFVSAVATVQHVISRTAIEPLGRRCAQHRIGKGRADDMLDADQPVAGCCAARAFSHTVQPNRNART